MLFRLMGKASEERFLFYRKMDCCGFFEKGKGHIFQPGWIIKGSENLPLT
jgi:hypothetical protein